MIKVSDYQSQNFSEISENLIKHFTKSLIASTSNSAAVIKKSINTLSKLLTSDQVTMKSSAFLQAFELSAAIMNVSELVYTQTVCILLSTSKQHHFILFSFKVNANSVKKLLTAIEECD